MFGPITLVWFAVIAAMGIKGIVANPRVLASLSPHYAWDFFARNGWHGFVVLGAVFLCVTGAEALYADMGHFGRRPIRLAWFYVVLPALVLNYFGQGALLLSNQSAAENPFYVLAPRWALYPLVALATAAAVIASQALISGAFSLTMQAVQLGYLPRLRIEHTSHTHRGQIYIAQVNWFLMVACIGLVIAFKTSSNLAAAYGIAVTMTMIITTVLFDIASRQLFGWSRTKAALVCLPFLVIELAFFGANALKIAHGGWFPLAIGALFNVIVLGDFNELKLGTDEQSLAVLFQAQPAMVDVFDHFKGKPVTHAGGKALDRIVISDAMFRENSGLRFSGVGIMRHGHGKGEDRVLYTDHFPVVAKFNVAE